MSKNNNDKKEILKNNKTKKENKNYKLEWKKEKEKNKKLEEKILNLNKQKLELQIQNQKNEIEFKKIAKTFQEKAQIKINEKNKEINEKLEKEKEHIKKYGSQKILESIIDHILNIEQAILAGKNNDSVKDYVIGFEMLLKQLYQELESNGAKIINPQIGQEFNPENHYAISMVEGKEKNQIHSVKKKGLKLYDRVIKPATVIVKK